MYSYCEFQILLNIFKLMYIYFDSSESSFRDFQPRMEQVSKNELRNAAACFSLTNIK